MDACCIALLAINSGAEQADKPHSFQLKLESMHGKRRQLPFQRLFKNCRIRQYVLQHRVALPASSNANAAHAAAHTSPLPSGQCDHWDHQLAGSTRLLCKQHVCSTQAASNTSERLRDSMPKLHQRQHPTTCQALHQLILLKSGVRCLRHSKPCVAQSNSATRCLSLPVTY